MYAVVELNGNQYVVKEGEKLKVHKLKHIPENKKIEIKNVLLYRDDKNIFIGKPYLENATVEAEFIKNGKEKKIIVFKYKKRKNYKRKKGHRQEYSLVQINKIILN